MLGATVQNVVAWVTWCLEFVQLWCKPYKENSAAGWGETKYFYTMLATAETCYTTIEVIGFM